MSELEELLNDFPEDVADLSREVCELVSKTAVGAKQKVQFGWKVVAFEYEKGFCAVAPHKNWVNVQFYSGVDLPDPSKMLEGTGKSMRHVKIRASDDLSDGVIALIKAASRLAQLNSD